MILDYIINLLKRKNRTLEIRKMFEFEAAHHLPKHTGLCQSHHGHSYKLAISVVGKTNEDGMIMDFGTLKKVVNSTIIEKLDHKDLNIVFSFHPTAENMVYWIWKQLEVAGLKNISKVELWETSGSCAILSRK